MGKETFHSDHEVYDMGPKDPNAPQIEGEELDRLRHAMAESGAQIGASRAERAKRDGDLDSDVVLDESEARRDQTSDTLFDPETVVDALEAMESVKEAATEIAATSLREERDIRIFAQEEINAKGKPKADEVTGRPESSTIMGSYTDWGRKNLLGAQDRGEQAREKHQKELEAQAAREASKGQLIQTPEQARQVGKKLADEQAQAKQAEEARGIIDKQAE